MIEIKTLEVAGIGPAVHAMRNPFDSWAKSDTHQGKIGDKDKELSNKLSDAGPEHAKHLRLCMVWAEVVAPLYWWKEFDTYRMGVEKLSCSTMHTIMNKPLSLSSFSCENLTVVGSQGLQTLIDTLNEYWNLYCKTDDARLRKLYWLQFIQLLPSSYNQRRTVMMSYAALRQICKQRKGHRLHEWHEFRNWCKTLPESWMIIDKDEED